MSTTSTEAKAPAGAAGPSAFQRRRRRRGLIAAVVRVALPASGGGKPGFTVAYGQGNVANSDSIIASQPSLAKAIPGKLKFVPFDAGVTAIAELRSGSLEAIPGDGHPPVVGGSGNGTGVTVVIAQSFDADALIVPPSISSPA